MIQGKSLTNKVDEKQTTDIPTNSEHEHSEFSNKACQVNVLI